MVDFPISRGEILSAILTRGGRMLGAIVDTVIGLVLIYLLFSILVSTVMEAASGIFKLRAQALEDSIAKLIEDPLDPKKVADAGAAANGVWASVAPMFAAHRNAAQARPQAAAAPGGPVLTYTDVYNHPLVAGTSGKDKPSYVPADNFARALLQVLASKQPAQVLQAGQQALQQGPQIVADVKATVDALPGGDLKTALQTLIGQAAGDFDKLRLAVGTWFDSAMDRLSGQYKRFTQLITFVVALILAIVFNVDTLHAFQRIEADPVARAALVSSAEQQVKTGQPGTTTSVTWAAVQSAEDNVAKLGPIGWTGYTWDGSGAGVAWFALAVFGWLITAAAALMGAPFWFDLLSTFVSIRNAGPKPPSSTSG
jgi:hypothetical protein